jgi:hypothetical protein
LLDFLAAPLRAFVVGIVTSLVGWTSLPGITAQFQIVDQVRDVTAATAFGARTVFATEATLLHC